MMNLCLVSILELLDGVRCGERVAWLPRARGQATRHRARSGISRRAPRLAAEAYDARVVVGFGCMIASLHGAAARASLLVGTAGMLLRIDFCVPVRVGSADFGENSGY
jgi:hypothetical protein